MKLIKPNAEILTTTDYSIVGVKKFIELVGRTCYKSEDKITSDSYNVFVQSLINSGHYAMLEHGTIYLTLNYDSLDLEIVNVIVNKYNNNKYSKVVYYNNYVFITTNLRVIIENGWLNDTMFMTEPTNKHKLRITAKFICNRQVSHEFVRHRVFSFAQESTRYCNYSKDKFGNELTFILPCWIEASEYTDQLCIEEDGTWDANKFYRLPTQSGILNALFGTFQSIECSYFELIKQGWKPQQAANILPNGLKTELVMTGFIEDWLHFFDLRALGKTGSPHPQAKELALSLYSKFETEGLINNKSTI